MSEKRYYWLKLKKDFFEEDTISWIEEQENGKDYVLFYLKMCLKSLKTNGMLIRNVGDFLVPYDAKQLSKITNTDIDTVKIAMSLFEKIGLIQILENGAIYLVQVEEMVGTETDKAQLMREKRARERLENGNNVTKNGNNVTTALPKRYTEKELEKEKEIEIDKEKDLRITSNSLCQKDLDTIINTWNSLNLQQLSCIRHKRALLTKTRIAESNIQTFLSAIKSIKDSPALLGQSKTGWVITYDWFIRPNNYVKVVEGNYIDRKNGGNADGNNKSLYGAVQETTNEYEELIRKSDKFTKI